MTSRNSQDYSILELVATQSSTHRNPFSENLEMEVMVDDGKQINFQRTALEVDVPQNQDSTQSLANLDVQYHPSPQSRRKWLFYGGILAFLIVVATVLGSVLGSRANKKASTLPFPSSNAIIAVQTATTTPAPTTTTTTTTIAAPSVPTFSSHNTADRVNINTKAYYRLTNMYLGRSQSLDIVKAAVRRFGKLQMADSGNSFGQFWHFAPVNDDINNPKYALRTEYRSEGFSLDVDVDLNDGSLHLAATGNFTGQHWTITPWHDGTETVRLTNDFTGPNFSLDTYADTHEPFLDSGNHSGQQWRLDKVGDFLG